MKKLILKKENIRIELTTKGKKAVIKYEFTDNKKNNLEDYIYLLEKIEQYAKSGEYSVEKQGVDAG